MGLIKFNKKNEKILTFLESDGITHNEFNRSSHYQSPDGRLYFGGLQGVTAFYPKDIYREAEEKSKLIVTNYYELNPKKGLFEDKISTFLKEKRITLSPDIQSFRIHFALLNYKNIKQNRYLYQIDDLEEDWTIQKEPFIRINQLPYGEYTLKIKAKDYTGQDAEDPLTIPIEVLAPFYRKTSWQIVIFALFILSTYFFIRWRIYTLQREKKKLAQLVAERTRVIKSQKQELEQINQTKDRLFAILAHDLRQPLHSFKSLSKSIYYLLKNDDKNRLDKLIKYLEKESGQLYHLLDNLLHWALAQRDELTIEPITLDLCETVESVLEYHRPLANRLGVKLLNEVAPETLLKADKRVLETIFRNLISNALRYTSKGTGWIKIAAFYRNNTVQIKVSDNGKGIRPEKLNNLFNLTTNKTNISLGLHLCKEMITLLEGDISAMSQINKGTTFTITLPNKRLLEIEQLVDY